MFNLIALPHNNTDQTNYKTWVSFSQNPLLHACLKGLYILEYVKVIQTYVVSSYAYKINGLKYDLLYLLV